MKLFNKFYYDYIDIKLSDYKGFDSDLAINKLLFFVFLGLALASLFITYYNATATLLLRKLTRIGAHGEEQGKTLSDIGLGDSWAVKSLLRAKSGALKSMISRCGEVELTFEEFTALTKERKHLRGLSKEEKRKKLSEIDGRLSPKINFKDAKFYIPEDKKDKAETFIADKSTTFVKGLVSCIILLAAYVVIALVMPSILSWVSGFIAE